MDLTENYTYTDRDDVVIESTTIIKKNKINFDTMRYSIFKGTIYKF